MHLPDDFHARLETVLSCPTAPFHEGAVHRVLHDAVAKSPRLRGTVDAHGNLEVRYGPGRPRLLFHCHTDHPALEVDGPGTARVMGGIRLSHLRGATLKTFCGTGPKPRIKSPVKGSKNRVRLSGAAGLTRGTPLLLDLPAYRLSGDKIRARAVDDLCAVASCLTMFDRLAAARWRGSVGALFTRAEEVGFAGALAWVKTTTYPKSTTIINLEMSSARPHTPQGAGPVLRVGDRITTFFQGVAVELNACAQRLAKTDQEFRHQRALMDGGACEASVFTFNEFRSGALCLPLKNYHNHTRNGGLGLEYVH
ncbi:MAG: M28 family peptidase, partial [Planctomycetota bacterium]|nr:M28 family peptidase [Planctomycetota bacterium]